MRRLVNSYGPVLAMMLAAVLAGTTSCRRGGSAVLLSITVDAGPGVGSIETLNVLVTTPSGTRAGSYTPLTGTEFTFPVVLPNLDLTGFSGLATVEVEGLLAGAQAAIGENVVTLIPGTVSVTIVIESLGVDECADGTDDCDANATCTDTADAFTCACNAGFLGDGTTCTDIDECTDGTDDCAADATCANNAGGFDCTCNPGFMGDGTTCTDVDECADGTDNCDVNAICTNETASFTCACDVGYVGDGITCTVAVGRVTWMGHDFFERNADVDAILGNAVLQANTTGPIAVLGYMEFADTSIGGEVENTDAAINDAVTAVGRTVTITPVADDALLPAMLPAAHVLVVYEMELGGTGSTIGTGLAVSMQAFLDGGGVVIVMDHYSSGALLLSAAGVMCFLGNYTTYGDVPITNTAPSHPIMAGVSSPTYTGSNGTGSFYSNDGTTLAVDGEGVPVVVHKDWNAVRFDGTVGAGWELRDAALDATGSIMSYHPAHIDGIYNMFGGNGDVYSPALDNWTTLPNVLPYDDFWFHLAPVGRRLYGFPNSGGLVRRFMIPTNTWATDAAFTGTPEYTATVSDEYGYVYGYASNGNVIRFNPLTNSVTYHATGLGSLFETRIVYDPTTGLLYLGQYGAPDLYSFSVASGSTTTLASIPEFQLNDIFCGDHAGHIYAAGDSGGTTMWQYDIATNTWASIPDLPVDHGNSGSCTVSETGYLYVGNGFTDWYRLPLF